MKPLCWIRKFLDDEQASTLTLTAVALPLFMGFAGLGLDASNWYLQKRTAQNLTDMAAIDAVHSGNYFEADALTAEVTSFLNDAGFNSETDTLAFNSPPTGGSYAGRNGFMEITVTRQVPLYFLNAFYGALGKEATVTVLGRAVAGTLTIGTQCVVSLDPNAARAIDVSGGATVNTDCGIAANSSASNAIDVSGSSSLTTASVQTVGDINVGGSATLNSTTPPQSLSSPAPDPYSDLDIPPISSCDATGKTTANNDDTLSPGRYCGDINVKGTNVTFDPGTYIIEGGSLTSNSGANFSGSGVTFIFTATTANGVGGVDMNGNTTASLSAPTSGTYQGILFYQDPIATYRKSSNISKFNGGSNLLLDGVIYFPSTDIVFNGGANADPSCMQIFAATVGFSGSSDIGNDDSVCTSLGLDTSPQQRIQLVE